MDKKFKIYPLELGPMDNFVYLIQDLATQRAAVVDPAWEVPQIIRLAKQHDLIITDVLLTHSHHDHVNGVNEILDKYDAELHLSHAEAQFWGRSLIKPSLHHGGDSIQLGETEIQILHTPGHTPGSVCYRLDDQLITGDTLFVFGCGRCDLNGGDPELMFDTLKRIKNDLPTSTVVHPGHNYAEQSTVTMAEQITGNPFLHFDKPEEFVQFRMHGHKRRTPYTAVSPEQARNVL